MNIFKKIPAVIASVAVIVSLSAVAVSANSYVPEVSDVMTEDVSIASVSATKAQREQAQQIIADYIAKNIPNGIADVSKMDKVAAYVASFTYDKSNSDPYLMVLNGSGSDYASAKLAVYMLGEVGLTAKTRYAYSENEEIPMKTATSMATTAVRLGDGSVYLLYIGGDVLGQKTFISQKLNSRFLYKEISKNKYAVYSWIQFDDEVKGYDKATKTVMNIPGYIDGHKIEVIAAEFTRGCIGVSKVTIPNTVTEIKRGAFVYTKRIQSISISSSVKTIAADVFSGNNCLKFTVDSNNKYFQAINGDLYSKDGKTLVSATGSSMTKIPSFVEVIGDDAFCGNDHIVDITIPATVKKISYAAFASCDNLRNVIIEGNGLTTVESRAFQTTKLISLNIPSSVTSFSYDAFNWAEIILVICPDGEISQKLTGNDEIQNLLVDTSGTLTGRTFTKKPTCESDGELKVNFSTGSSKTYTIPKSNLYHDYKVDAIKSETCTNDGCITYRCTVCNSHRTEDTTYATGHSFSSTWTLDKAPTCIAEGVKSHHCVHCTAKKDETAIAKTAHTYKQTIVAAKVDSKGYTLNKCVYCGYSYKNNYTPLRPMPSKVTGLTFGARGSDYVSLKWNKDSNADGYILEYLSGNKFVKLIDKASGSAVSFKATWLTPGTLYKFRIRSYSSKSDGTRVYGTYSNVLRVRTVPSVMSGLSLGARTDTSVSVKLDKNIYANGAIIEMWKNGKWVAIATKTTNSAVSHKITGLSPSTSYKIRVIAYTNDEGGRIYSVSNPSLTVETAPTAVSNFRSTLSAKTAIRFNWDENTTADGYIFEMLQNGKWITTAKIKGGSTKNYSQLKLASDRAYNFRIRAYKIINGKTVYGSCSYTAAKTAK